MAVGKLTIVPETVRNLPFAGLNDARLFVGCFIQESEKSRTHAEVGPQPYWKDTLACNVSEGQNYLYLELINESPYNGGLVATGTASLNQVFNQGTESQWVSLRSTSGQPFGELSLRLSFNGSSTTGSSSYGEFNMPGGQHVSYQQQESRSSSFSSLGPSNPMPDNYGAGKPPPFHPPPSTGSSYYPSENKSYNGLVGPDGVVSPDKMTEREFEEAKARGTIPTWAKYGGGALALGLAAWGAHELKEHYEKKDHKKHSGGMMPGFPQGHSMQNLQHQFLGGGKHKEKKHKKKFKKHGSSSSSSSSSSDSD